MEAELKRVYLSDTTEIELPKTDVKQYIGTRARIERTEEYEGKFGYFVKIETAPVAMVGQGDRKIELRASRCFSLHRDDKGRIGWGRETKLGAFLQKQGVAHYRELIGREVIVQTQEKGGTDFLTF